ncbi:30S ribosome-binding factor RbfA [Rugosimonospora acidiphila]|uniref:Ribosome-binding factor A n=1 Tax=Rugosimonospora acidiphila TaxID=556531 RepID=A0ABP9RNX1_9ACTN
MTDPARVRRHAERVRELVASVVRTQIKDPRLGMITITDARITADLRDATVFYTVLGDADEQAATAAALESAKGLLRSTVGKALGLRHSPTLTFVLDNVQDHVKHIDELLAVARESDAEVERLAAGAEYAGDSQPYRLEEPEDAGELEELDGSPDSTELPDSDELPNSAAPGGESR